MLEAAMEQFALANCCLHTNFRIIVSCLTEEQSAWPGCRFAEHPSLRRREVAAALRACQSACKSSWDAYKRKDMKAMRMACREKESCREQLMRMLVPAL
jgi:hypothetical protein